jgi:copper chaperone CopZ
MLAAMFLFGAVHAVSAQENRKNEELVVFHVSMSCHSCEQKINKNIPYEKGVQDLTVELEKRLVTIKYRTDKTDKDKLKKAIEKLGFTCEEVRKEN